MVSYSIKIFSLKMSFSVQTHASVSLRPIPISRKTTRTPNRERDALDYYPNKSSKKYDELKIKVSPIFKNKSY